MNIDVFKTRSKAYWKEKYNVENNSENEWVNRRTKDI